MNEMEQRTSRIWRVAGEIVFVPFLACVCVILFHSLLFAAEDRAAIRKSIRMTAHDEFGGRCPFRACPSLLAKPTDGMTMAVELDSGDGTPAERLHFRFSEKSSQWIPVPATEPNSEPRTE